VESAPDHWLFRNAIDRARTRYVPALVLAEVDYFLRDERRAMQVFMQDVARGAFTYAPPSLGQLSRAMEIDRRYEDTVCQNDAGLQADRILRERSYPIDVTAAQRRSICTLSDLSWPMAARVRRG